MSGIKGGKVSCYNVNILEQLRRDRGRKIILKRKLASLEPGSIEHAQTQDQINYLNRRFVKWLTG